MFYGYLDKYFVSFRFGPEAYAIYSVGCFNLPFIAILRESVGAVMIPRVSRLQTLGRHREILETIAAMMRKVAAVYFPLYALLLVTGREFLTVLFTAQYAVAWPIFAVHLTWILLDYIFCSCDPIIRAYPEHLGFAAGLRAVLLVVLLVSLWFGTRAAGLVGTILIAVAVNLVDRLYIAFRLARAMGVGREDLRLLADVGRIALAAAGAGLVAATLRPLLLGLPALATLFGCTVALTLVYILALYLLRVPTPKELGAVSGRVRSLLPFRAATRMLI
jgi:O-antigen/teichoic acid export membrane protein